MTNPKTINDLRERLFAAMDALADKTLDVDRAREISALAKEVISTARVEVDYLRATGQLRESAFLAGGSDGEPVNGITGIVRHRLAG